MDLSSQNPVAALAGLSRNDQNTLWVLAGMKYTTIDSDDMRLHALTYSMLGVISVLGIQPVFDEIHWQTVSSLPALVVYPDGLAR